MILASKVLNVACAYKAFKILEEIKNFEQVKIICSSGFKECYANLNWSNTKNNIDIQTIKEILETEGFELKYISGNFIGTFDDKLDKFNLIDSGLGSKFIKSPQGNLVLPINTKTIINAKLIFKNKLNEFWMTLN